MDTGQTFLITSGLDWLSRNCGCLLALPWNTRFVQTWPRAIVSLLRCGSIRCRLIRCRSRLFREELEPVLLLFFRDFGPFGHRFNATEFV